MKLLHTFGILCLLIILPHSAMAAACVSLDKQADGIAMSSSFPAPQVWINMMPTIIDIEPVPPTSINVAMQLTNNTNSPITYTFPSSQTFDIFIKDTLGNVITQWSKDKFFLQVITSRTLDPGMCLTVGGTVPLTDFNNAYIEPGDYVVSIELNNIDNATGPVLLSTTTTSISRRPSSQMPLRIDWAF